jgi:hypothetical protein
MNDQVAVWRGALLWPDPLVDAPVLDFHEVEAIGVWLYAWLRERPGRAVVGASAGIKRQLQRAGVPVLWYRAVEEVPSTNGGVTPSEREMLWG